jgi:hypothetical protein
VKKRRERDGRNGCVCNSARGISNGIILARASTNGEREVFLEDLTIHGKHSKLDYVLAGRKRAYSDGELF